MNYYGRVIEENFNGDFLKEALLQVDEELPFRGPLFYQKGEYLYLLRIQGKIDFFQVVLHFCGIIDRCDCQRYQSDDRVKRCTDLMAHAC